MRKKTSFQLCLVCLLFSMCAVQAEDTSNQHSFYETSDDIVKALSGSAQQSDKDLGKSRSLFGGDDATRSLKRKKVAVMRVDKTTGKHTQGLYETGGELGKANLKIEFDSKSWRIRESAVSLLSELGKALNNAKLVDKAITIAGHTDSMGEDNYNMNLSLQRAQSIRDYLSSNHGIEQDRFEIIGFGESMPLVENSTPQNRQLNRRVEIISH